METMQVSTGLSTQKDPVRAAYEAVQQARANFRGEKLELAIVFATTDLSQESLTETVSLYLGETPLVGCSTAALITNKGILKSGVAVTLLDLPRESFLNMACVNGINEKGSLQAGHELAEKLLYGFHNVRRDLSVIFCDGLIKDGSNLIRGMQDRLGSSFPVVGASASDNLLFAKTYIYFGGKIMADSACGVIFGGKLNFGYGVKHGWQPLGKPRHVTKSEGNTVREIDGSPAAKLYEEYFAYDLAKLKKELRRISILYPIGIFLPGETEYLLRNIISVQDDGSLIFQGDVPRGAEIRLMIGTKESCLSAASLALNEAKKAFAKDKPGLALIFDSISRKILLGRDAHKELELIISEIDTATPVSGIYTYSEQAPLRALNYLGKSYFHNQTVTVLAMGG